VTTFVHTADWQIGKPFASIADPAKRARVQQADRRRRPRAAGRVRHRGRRPLRLTHAHQRHHRRRLGSDRVARGARLLHSRQPRPRRARQPLGTALLQARTSPARRQLPAAARAGARDRQGARRRADERAAPPLPPAPPPRGRRSNRLDSLARLHPLRRHAPDRDRPRQHDRVCCRGLGPRRSSRAGRRRLHGPRKHEPGRRRGARRHRHQHARPRPAAARRARFSRARGLARLPRRRAQGLL